MKRHFLIPLLLLTVISSTATLASAQEENQTVAVNRGVYTATVLYPGEFKSEGIYSRHPAAMVWNLLKAPVSVNAVRCRAATAAFSASGQWLGRLNADGSCGPLDDLNEINMLRTGNYLNFERTLIGN